MLLAFLIGLIIFLELFGTPLRRVFLDNYEYVEDRNEYQGDYLVTGEEWDIAEEIEERQETLRLLQDSTAARDWEEDFVEEGFGETEAEQEEHY